MTQKIKKIGCAGSLLFFLGGGFILVIFSCILFWAFSIFSSLFWNVRYDEEFWGIHGGAIMVSCFVAAIASFFLLLFRLARCKWMNKIKKSMQTKVLIGLPLIISIPIFFIPFSISYYSCYRPEVLVKTPKYDYYESGNYRKIFYPNGTRYEGTGRTPSKGSIWLKDGEGIFYKSNGEYRSETWDDNILISHGKWQSSK
jgi:hypothetical protein